MEDRMPIIRVVLHRIGHAFNWDGPSLRYELDTVTCTACGWRYVFMPEDEHGGGWG